MNLSVDWKRNEREAKAARLRKLLASEPDLRNWQLAERLGLSECQVIEIRRKTRGVRKVRS